MIRFYFIVFIISCAILSLPSCLKDDEECVISDDCYTSKIDSGDIYIRVSQEGQNGVPVILYNGYVEDNDIVWQDTVYQEEVILYMPVGPRYAAEAYYNKNNQTVVALDGKKFKQDKHKECWTNCYDFPTMSLDCRKL